MAKKTKDEKKRKVKDPAEEVSANDTAPTEAPNSLVNLLFKAGSSTDAQLDDIFSKTKVTVPQPLIPSPSPEAKSKKRKRSDPDDVPSANGVKAARIESDQSDDDEEETIEPESLSPKGKSEKKGKRLERPKHVETEEEKQAKADRTLFVGNVPKTCATKQSAKRALLAFLTGLLPDNLKPPACQIDSIRFRSLALAAPVQTKARPVIEPSALSHSAKRAAEHRAAHTGDQPATSSRNRPTDAVEAEPPKQYLTEAQKRKVKYIQGELHSDIDACIAFVVWSGQSSEAIQALVGTPPSAANFMDHTLRFDVVASGKATVTDRAEQRRTVFIGGLDFGQSEEGLRQWVEAAIVQERGAPSEATPWVERVRLIRDRESGMGKGIAYVLFKDVECVDELMALPPERTKLLKRKLRIQRCASEAKLKALKNAATKKVTPSFSKGLAKPLGSKSKKSTTKSPKTVTPAQAAKAAALRKLPKEERKASKSVDEERVARRLEKKQAKVVSERRARKAAKFQKK